MKVGDYTITNVITINDIYKNYDGKKVGKLIDKIYRLGDEVTMSDLTKTEKKLVVRYPTIFDYYNSFGNWLIKVNERNVIKNPSLAECKRLIAQTEREYIKPTISHYRDMNGMRTTAKTKRVRYNPNASDYANAVIFVKKLDNSPLPVHRLNEFERGLVNNYKRFFSISSQSSGDYVYLKNFDSAFDFFEKKRLSEFKKEWSKNPVKNGTSYTVYLTNEIKDAYHFNNKKEALKFARDNNALIITEDKDTARSSKSKTIWKRKVNPSDELKELAKRELAETDKERELLESLVENPAWYIYYSPEHKGFVISNREGILIRDANTRKVRVYKSRGKASKFLTDNGQTDFQVNPSHKLTSEDFTKIERDTNGNPRYVIGWWMIGDTYEQALKIARKIGGKKYHNKKFGGGIVFQSYNIDRTTEQLNELVKNPQTTKRANAYKLSENFDTKLDELSRMFQGKLVKVRQNVLKSDLQPKKTWRLGYLSRVLIDNPENPNRQIDILFNNESYLAADRRKNLWLCGKDAIINGIKLPKDNELKFIGWLNTINYITEKAHIENGKTTEFYHRSGEVNKDTPSVWIDADGFLILQGGDYDIWKEGIVN